MYKIYVLLSLKDGRTYTGCTHDIGRRLTEHNRGKVKATKSRKPLKILFTEEYKTEKEAKKRELW